MSMKFGAALAALTLLAAGVEPASAAGGVTLTVSAAVGGGAFSLVAKPTLKFKCSQAGVVMTCVAHTSPISSVQLRAQLITDYSGNGPAIKDGQWQGDCAGTKGVVCTLDLSKSRTVRLSVR